MSGFFKKLFNRITGKKEEPAPEVQVEQAQLPAPEPVVEEVVVAKPVKPQAKPKAAAPKKPEPKKPVLKKPVAKAKPAAKKPEPPKAKAKPVKAPPKKVEPVKAPALKKTPAKKIAEPKKTGVETIKVAPPVPPPPPPVVLEAPPPPPPAPPPVETVDAVKERKGWFSRLTEGLSKSSKSITGSITAIFTKRKLDKETLQELEDTLIQADLGLAVSERIIAEVSRGRFDKEIDPEEVKQILAAEVAKVLKPVEVPFNFGSEKPFVILVVGVNGSGKTTTIGKLGSIAAQEGFKVKFAACDTFRAAAIEQLTVWGQRIGAETISRPQGADAAGLAFDAMKAAQDDGTDILFIDTAGRLHNKTYLMDELDKVVRVIKKYDAAAPHAVLLVLDATTGQNALAQADAFTKVAGVTGLIMTKLDGTARGGILVAIAETYKLPIHAIGVGESIEDLQAFDADAFARAIAGLDDR
jgi:fused signal recognition particle receptor